MKIATPILFLYGALVLVGGFVGYVKAGSVPSLIAGLFFGGLLLGCAVMTLKKKKRALYIALSATFFLDAFFTYRYCLSLQFFPSGMMSLCSLATLLFLVFQLRKMR